MMKKTELEVRLTELGSLLMADLKSEGYWEGRLSSSALAVAVAVAALYFDNYQKHSVRIHSGMNWLKMNINSDGSFGDTPDSPGNVSTSLLVYATANLLSEKLEWVNNFQQKISEYLSGQGVDVNSSQVSEVILNHYHNDYTFSVPILTMCGLCRIPEEEAFDHIPQLPFELSLLPRKFYRLLNLNVVSYAVPALVAVGIVIFKKKKANKLWRGIRRFSIPKAMRILQRMLPVSGGYLEAIPLTAFVSLSLTEAGYRDTEEVKKGIYFLTATQRTDGSWPIDVDLSTWVTSLAVKAFRNNLNRFVNSGWNKKISKHFKQIQNKAIHPFNGTGPGGWGWTNYSGSVPDGDDTPGVILALLSLQPKENIKGEVLDACNWLFTLQNNDGGFPTFSRGWGKLPFDQSCSDLTGHNLFALSSVMETYRNELSIKKKKALISSINKALHYLIKHQQADGSWLPLWFGNQFTQNHANPVYGTARVISYIRDAAIHEWLPAKVKQQMHHLIIKGSSYLVSVQNKDGSWGGSINIRGTIEETALAVSALASAENLRICNAGLEWLDNFYRQNGLQASPIGLYFASLWYDEKLYPVTAYLEAISRVLEVSDS